MGRRRISKKRAIFPDSVYSSQVVSKFINKIMKSGEKSKAETICYGCFDIIEKREKKNPLEVFQQAVENVKPVLEVRSRRVGGATYQIPVEVRPGRREALAFRWILQFARQRKGKSMREKLAEEIIMAFRKEGLAIKKKEDTQRTAFSG